MRAAPYAVNHLVMMVAVKARCAVGTVDVLVPCTLAIATVQDVAQHATAVIVLVVATDVRNAQVALWIVVD